MRALEQLRETLSQCLAVPYPLLTLATSEEQRAVQFIEECASSVGAPVRVYSCAGSSQQDGRGACLDLLATLEEQNDPAVFVLLDPHLFMSQGDVVRAVRDRLPAMEERKQSLVFVNATGRVPPELMRDAVRLELPLPDEPVLAAIIVAEFSVAEFELSEDELGRAVRACRGLTGDETRRLCRRLAQSPRGTADQVIASIVQEKERLLKMTDLIELTQYEESLDQVAGLDELKRWLAERAGAFSDEARQFGLPQPKGLLLLGVQGCGKSLTAKTIGELWKLPVARFDLASLYTTAVSPEQSLRMVLRLAEAVAPVVLWIDELEKSFHGVGGQGSDSLHRIFGSFVTWMQEKTAPVFVVATANNVQQLPPELLRKGRFDEIFFVDLPDVHAREAAFRIHLSRRERDPSGFALDALAHKTEHFSCAEIEQCVVGALYAAFSEGVDLCDEHLSRTVAGTVPLFFTYEEQIKSLREWASTRARPAASDSSLLDLFQRGTS